MAPFQGVKEEKVEKLENKVTIVKMYEKYGKSSDLTSFLLDLKKVIVDG